MLICSLAILVAFLNVQIMAQELIVYAPNKLWNLILFLLYCVFMDDNVHDGSKDKSDTGEKDHAYYTCRKLTVYPVSTSVNVRVSRECTPGDMARKSIRTD